MTHRHSKTRMTPQERQAARDRLRELDHQKPEGIAGRIRRAVSYPPTGGNPKRYRFGIGLILVAILELALVAALPSDNRRWLFIIFSWITALAGAWQVDKARKR